MLEQVTMFSPSSCPTGQVVSKACVVSCEQNLKIRLPLRGISSHNENHAQPVIRGISSHYESCSACYKKLKFSHPSLLKLKPPQLQAAVPFLIQQPALDPLNGEDTFSLDLPTKPPEERIIIIIINYYYY